MGSGSSQVSVWFEGDGEIDCSLDDVARSLQNAGEHHVGIVTLMPGMTSVELIDGSDDHATIRTNEGLMRRTGIETTVGDDQIVLEYDEVYEAGSMVKTTSHFRDEFTTSSTGVAHRIVVSDVESPGLLGFFYRKFGSSRMGGAFLASTKRYLES